MLGRANRRCWFHGTGGRHSTITAIIWRQGAMGLARNWGSSVQALPAKSLEGLIIMHLTCRPFRDGSDRFFGTGKSYSLFEGLDGLTVQPGRFVHVPQAIQARSLRGFISVIFDRPRCFCQEQALIRSETASEQSVFPGQTGGRGGLSKAA